MYEEIASNKRKTVFIMAGFFALVGGMAWLYGAYYGDPGIAYFALFGAAVYATIMYFSGSRLSLAVNGARQISKPDDVRLWRVVENLSIANGLPMPKVYIMDDDAANAFATGRDPDHSAVCVTTGLLKILNDTELEGVISHELAHIRNYDVRVSMIAFALTAAISVLADFLFRLTWAGGSKRSVHPVILIAGLASLIVAPLVASLIQLAISRRREYLADASGALATRYPEGLASALEKIALAGSAVKKQNPATAHLFFANPLKKDGGLAGLFSTHPPVEERVARLRAMIGQVQ